MVAVPFESEWVQLIELCALTRSKSAILTKNFGRGPDTVTLMLDYWKFFFRSDAGRFFWKKITKRENTEQSGRHDVSISNSFEAIPLKIFSEVKWAILFDLTTYDFCRTEPSFVHSRRKKTMRFSNFGAMPWSSLIGPIEKAPCPVNSRPNRFKQCEFCPDRMTVWLNFAILVHKKWSRTEVLYLLCSASLESTRFGHKPDFMGNSVSVVFLPWVLIHTPKFHPIFRPNLLFLPQKAK